jgi:hypothetical protein
MNQDLPAFLRCLTEPTEEKISAALEGRRKQRRKGKVAAAREGEGLGFLAVFHLVGIKCWHAKLPRNTRITVVLS